MALKWGCLLFSVNGSLAPLYARTATTAGNLYRNLRLHYRRITSPVARDTAFVYETTSAAATIDFVHLWSAAANPGKRNFELQCHLSAPMQL
jgi:hypothetical protein